MVLGVTQGADFNFLVVSTISEVFSGKQLNKHFIFDERTYVRMKKCVEKWNVRLKPPLGRLFLLKNMPHRKCTHFKIFVSKELRARLKIQK